MTWRVTLPGETALNLTIFTASNETSLNGYITIGSTIRSNEYIESTLNIELQPDLLFEPILLECLIEGLGNATAVVTANTSSKYSEKCLPERAVVICACICVSVHLSIATHG